MEPAERRWAASPTSARVGTFRAQLTPRYAASGAVASNTKADLEELNTSVERCVIW
jgi:hypothetical protein